MRHRKEIVASRYLQNFVCCFLFLFVGIFLILAWDGRRDPNNFEVYVILVDLILIVVFIFLRNVMRSYESHDLNIVEIRSVRNDAHKGIVDVYTKTYKWGEKKFVYPGNIASKGVEEELDEALRLEVIKRDQWGKAQMHRILQKVYNSTSII